jgi:lysophospholipid acyltransferase (LPLAT)-like uncharacterized protein
MSGTPSWRDSRAKRLQAAAIPAAMWPILEFLGGGYNYRYIGRQHLDQLVQANQPHILALWHGRILEVMLALRDRGYVSLVSENFDGEWIARLSAHFGFGAFRGSSSRGGARALVQAKRLLAGGESLLFTLDGPRGPKRVAQPGAVWLAGASGCPILPVRLEADRFLTTSTWDAHQFPSPGATVTAAFGAPMYVPDGLDEAGLEAERLKLENTLNAPLRV